MYEDWRVEASILPAGGRLFCVASAGCTALALAGRGASVTAVDVNPAQIAYIRQRLDGAPPRAGSAERLLGRIRSLRRLAGWEPGELARFCELADVIEQRRFWTERLDTGRLRTALAVALNPLALRSAFDPSLLAALPPRFDRVLRRRIERGLGRHPNRDNGYARFLFLGSAEQPEPQPGIDLTLACADAAGFLERASPASFAGFSLSNILDSAPPAYRARLLAAVRRAAEPGAAVILRSFAQPASIAEDEWAARDRSFLWGSVRVERC